MEVPAKSSLHEDDNSVQVTTHNVPLPLQRNLEQLR